MWLAYREQNIDSITNALKAADYTWIIFSLFLAILSHISRAIRWNLLIRPMGYKPKNSNAFMAVLVMYLSNIAIPRSGEVTRCGIMSRYEKIPFTKLLGTVFVERVFDFIILFIFLLIVLLTQFTVVLDLIKNNPAIYDRLIYIYNSKLLIIGFLSLLILFVFLIYYFRKRIKSSFVYKKIEGILKDFIVGIIAIKDLKEKWAFIGHTIFIWLAYFFMIYISFWSFEFSANLSVLTGLTVFVMASFGMVAPSPGGIGTWHFMVIETMAVYGIAKEPDASAFALAVHGSMTLFMIVIGFVSMVLLPILNKNKN